MSFDRKLLASMTDGGVIGLPATPSPFSPEHGPIFITLVPVHQHSTSASEPQRLVKGFIAASFEIEGLLSMSKLSELTSDIHFKLIDETGDDGLRILYQTESFATGLDHWYKRPVIDVFGRKWTVMAAPKPGYISSRISFLPHSVVVGGLVFTVLLLLYLNLLRRQAEVVQKQVGEQTSQLREVNESLNYANARLEELSRIDPLTEVANRRFFNESIAKEWNRAQREAIPMALLLIDVDHFKNYNDCYGHLQGDECLQAVATELKKVFSRSGDLVARYGGEEFAIILPNAGGEAMRMAEKCRAAIEKLQIRHAETTTGDFVTISVGLSSVIPTADLKSEDLIDCADKGLYIAKEHGRNRVIYHTCHARLGKFKVA
jgi:diguanylate cyclase (GGDEF)-like protein